ncbi:MAG: class I SAM-dependent methyltransferase [Pseudomonadota bacterium]
MSKIDNFGLRDEIKEYWSGRAATFDLQPGHEIFSEEERAAWQALIRRHLGSGPGRTALDLASGTGVISHLMDDLGYQVTGLDWAEPMLERAQAKAKDRKRDIRFMLGDAENTYEPDNTYDVIITRHLVWTLVDPAAAFAEWFRVLKPGGQILLIDGDFVSDTWIGRLHKGLVRMAAKLGKSNGLDTDQMRTHRDILARVYFSSGARAGDIAGLLTSAGFDPVTVDTDLRAIHRTQKPHLGWFKGLERGAQHRYAICAQKPLAETALL